MPQDISLVITIDVDQVRGALDDAGYDIVEQGGKDIRQGIRFMGVDPDSHRVTYHVMDAIDADDDAVRDWLRDRDWIVERDAEDAIDVIKAQGYTVIDPDDPESGMLSDASVKDLMAELAARIESIKHDTDIVTDRQQNNTVSIIGLETAMKLMQAEHLSANTPEVHNGETTP
jgi:hypothetical protein